MREQAFRFGRARHLVGVAGVPSATPGAVGVIVLNAGLVHRVGPFRLHVDMTRRLNELGYPTLRFDISTVGDSGSSGESQTRAQQVRADVDDAMALLHQHGGCSRFVLVGLCSGAQDVHTVACRPDSHVKLAGAVFLDGYAYRTIGFRLRHYLPRLFDARRWWRWLVRKSREVAGGGVEPMFGVSPLPQDVVRVDLAGMLDRGLKLCLVYSGGINMDFNHSRQFRECFGAIMNRSAVSTRYIEEADHTYVLAQDRRHLIVHIEEWLQRNFPIAHAGVPS
jgi:hypothetical protein